VKREEKKDMKWIIAGVFAAGISIAVLFVLAALAVANAAGFQTD